MKKLLITISALVFVLPVTHAQLWKVRRLELSFGVGTTQFFSDIGGYTNDKNLFGLRDFTFRQTRININESVRYRFSRKVSIRGNMVWGILHSTDERGSNRSRGYEENTVFIEYSALMEYHFIKNKDEINFEILRLNHGYFSSMLQCLDFYLFAGFGTIAYDIHPNSSMAKHVFLNSGEAEVLPAGFGLNFLYSNRINFGVEFGARVALSDNLDGFSSIYSRTDIFHLVNFNVKFKIKTNNNCPEVSR